EPPRRIADYRDAIARPPMDPPDRLATETDFGSFLKADGSGHYWSSTPFIVHGARLVSGYAGLAPVRRLDYAPPATSRVAGHTARTARRRFLRLFGALPRARLVANASTSAQPAADLAAIDVETTALVDEAVELESGPAGAAAIAEDRPGAIRIAV